MIVSEVALPKLTSPLKFDVPASVVIPVILRFLPVISSYVMSPVTSRFPPTVTIPEKHALPLVVIVAPIAVEPSVPFAPTTNPPFAVTIPANAALPAE